jgi:hypothetical protein
MFGSIQPDGAAVGPGEGGLGLQLLLAKRLKSVKGPFLERRGEDSSFFSLTPVHFFLGTMGPLGCFQKAEQEERRRRSFELKAIFDEGNVWFNRARWRCHRPM